MAIGNIKFKQSGTNNYSAATETIPEGYRPTTDLTPIQCGNVNFALLVDHKGAVTMLGDPASAYTPMVGVWTTDDPIV